MPIGKRYISITHLLLFLIVLCGHRCVLANRRSGIQILEDMGNDEIASSSTMVMAQQEKSNAGEATSTTDRIGVAISQSISSSTSSTSSSTSSTSSTGSGTSSSSTSNSDISNSDISNSDKNSNRDSSNSDVSNTAADHDALVKDVSTTQDGIIENKKTATPDSKVQQEEQEELEEDPNEPTKVQADASSNNSPSAALPPVPQITSCRTQGQIAVTYSEGPSDATASIVRQLNHADAHANFFVNASWLYTQQYAMVVQNTYNAGHLIGMTYRVKNDDSSKLTDEELKHDILEKAHIIETLIKVSPKYVRLHYTDPEDTRTENMMKKLGFILVGYNLDSQDYARKPVEEVYRNAFRSYKETYDAKGSFISVQYDMPGTTKVSTVPTMINTISDEGYTMVRLDGCLNDPKPYKKSAESLEYVGDKFSFNSSGYRQGQNIVDQKVIEEAKKEDSTRSQSKVGSNDSQTTTSSASSIRVHSSMLVVMLLALLVALA